MQVQAESAGTAVKEVDRGNKQKNKNRKEGTSGMNILIVDDEKLAVEVIKNMIQWESYGIGSVYTAYSMKQAVEAMERHQISILLCDIEMPKGSGLEVAAWIQEQKLDIKIIFLTSHALFQYASQAIKYGVSDYLLKPVVPEELEQAIQLASEKIQLQKQMEQNEKYASYWNSGKTVMQQEFWKSYLSGGKEYKNLQSMSRKIDIDAEPGTVYYPILLSWSRKKNRGTVWDDEIIEFSIRNIVSEVLFGKMQNGNFVLIRNNCILAVYPVQQETQLWMREKCKMMLDRCGEYLSFCNISCYVKGDTTFENLKVAVDMLIETEEEDILKENRVIVAQQDKEVFQYQKPDMEPWVTGLFDKNQSKVLMEIQKYLEEVGIVYHADSKSLGQFQHDFLQELYIVLERKGIYAHSVLSSPRMLESFNRASRSIADMVNWVSDLSDSLVQYDYKKEKTPDMIKEIKIFIEENSGEEISRNDLAAKVFLHPDYLSRIFKEQMGISLSDFIIQVRIDKAKVLLQKTDDRISDISAKVGYPNTAYFTKLFKRATGMTPKEFRKA